MCHRRRLTTTRTIHLRNNQYRSCFLVEGCFKAWGMSLRHRPHSRRCFLRRPCIIRVRVWVSVRAEAANHCPITSPKDRNCRINAAFEFFLLDFDLLVHLFLGPLHTLRQESFFHVDPRRSLAHKYCEETRVVAEQSPMADSKDKKTESSGSSGSSATGLMDDAALRDWRHGTYLSGFSRNRMQFTPDAMYKLYVVTDDHKRDWVWRLNTRHLN